MTDVSTRFLSKIVVADGCWLWQGHKVKGYGYFWYQRRNRRAHRLIYELLHGPTPSELDHTCRNRACVNPDHLEPVTTQENLNRSPLHYANRTHCPKGHPYDDTNTYHLPTGGRGCKRCRVETTKQWRKARHRDSHGGNKS